MSNPQDQHITNLEAQLTQAKADSEENYQQGIRKGVNLAMKAINSMPEPKVLTKMDRVVHYAIRADCATAIREAIDAFEGGE